MYTVSVNRGRGVEGTNWLIKKGGDAVEFCSGIGCMKYHEGSTQFQ